MKNKTVPTTEIKKTNNVVFHMDKVEATLQTKPYIIPDSKSGTYSKLDKATKKAELKLKKELKSYSMYDR